MASASDIRAGAAYVELYLRKSAFAKGLVAMGAQLKAFGTQVSAIGKTAMALGAGLAVALAVPVKIFADFDDQMRIVKAVTQASVTDFEKLTATAKELGRTTSYTAGQVAAMMAELGRAGFDPTQVDAMTSSVLDLAKATATDGAQSAGIMAATIRQFGMDAGDASKVADVLTAGANKSFNTLESLAEALTYAGPVAADFNMSLEDTVAILGTLGNVGIQGSSAGTALRRMLILTGAEAEKLKNIFGVEFVDAAGNARPLVDVLQEVADATANLGTAEKAKKFNEAFGLLGITGASSIAKNVAGTRELRDAIGQAGGLAKKTATEMESGLGGSLRKLWSAIEGVAISIGEALTPMITDLADKLAAWSLWLTSLIGQNPDLVKQVVYLAAGLVAGGATLVAFGTAATGLGVVIGSIGAGIAGLGTMIGVMGGAIAAVLSPVGLLIAGLISLAVYIVQATGAGKEIGAAFSKAFSQIGEIAGKAVSGVRNALAAGNLDLAAKVALAGLNAVWTAGMAGILNAATGVAKQVVDVWGEAVKNIAKEFSSLASQEEFRAIFAWYSGVDMAKEQKRGQKLNKDEEAVQRRILKQMQERREVAAAAGDEEKVAWYTREIETRSQRLGEIAKPYDLQAEMGKAIDQDVGSQVDKAKGYLDDLKAKAEADAAAARAELDAANEKAAGLARRQAWLEDLSKKAREGREAAAAEAAKLASEAGDGLPKPGEGPKLPGPAGRTAGTFSSRVEQVLGGGAGPLDKIEENTKETAKELANASDKFSDIRDLLDANRRRNETAPAWGT